MDDAGIIADNPWLSPAAPVASSSRSDTLTAIAAVSHCGDPLFAATANNATDGLISAASTAASTNPSAPSSVSDWDVVSQATRPSLSRLTSSIGSEARIVQPSPLNGSSALLLHGLERLAFANASQESVSTEEGGVNGTRRSLDQIRRLSLAAVASKGKRRAQNSVLENSLVDEAEGREAILHQVAKTDSLVKIALLYGCTVQAIRGANKLWLNDHIQLRKTLYIPLDACTQPPSREVEFIQLAGEDAIHLFMRQATTAQAASAVRNGHSRYATDQPIAGRLKEPSYRASLDSDYAQPFRDNRAHSPATPHRGTVTLPDRNGSNLSSETYLPGTNAEYTSDDFRPFVSANTGETSPWITPLPSRSATPSSVNTTKKTLAIVRIPDITGTARKSRDLSARPTSSLSLDTENIGMSNTQTSGLATPRVVKSSTLKPSLRPELTPTSSSEALVMLGATSGGLRSRPRTPLSNSPIEASLRAFPTSPNAKSPSAALSTSAFPPRTRKASRDTHAGSASSGVSAYLSAGTGLLSSLLGTSGTSGGWLAADQEEMQLARDYRNKTRPIALPRDSESDVSRHRQSADMRGSAASYRGKKAEHSGLQPPFGS